MKKLTCHCGEIEAEINLDGDLQKVLQCNCSICKRKNAIMSMVKNEDFKIVKGKDKLKLYQFHSKVAKHYFCTNCGIYTHHNPRVNPAMTGFNLGCIDEINTFNLKNELKKNNILILSSPIKATYDKPFTLPMLRRNEAMFKIDINL